MSKLFSNCYVMDAKMYIKKSKLNTLRQIKYCDLDDETIQPNLIRTTNPDEGILRKLDIVKKVPKPIGEKNYPGIIMETDPDSSVLINFDKKTFILNASLDFKFIKEDLYIINDELSIDKCVKNYYGANVAICMQKEDIPYINYILNKDSSIIFNVDDLIIRQYEKYCYDNNKK